jgi:hypothetical protein
MADAQVDSEERKQNKSWYSNGSLNEETSENSKKYAN